MKYYKKINNTFLGFFSEEVNNAELFDISFNNEGEIQKKLKNNFYEIEEKQWINLLNGQTEGKEIRILKNGELGLYEYPICTKNFIKKIFNWEIEEWEEGATLEEQLDYYKNKIIECNKQISLEKESGFFPSKDLFEKRKKYSELHMQVSQILAIEINKNK